MAWYLRLMVLAALLPLFGCATLTPRYITGSALERARILYENGRLREAKEVAAGLGQGDPEYSKAQRLIVKIKAVSAKLSREHAEVGREYEKAGIRRSAISEYKKSVRLDPSNATARRRLARLGVALPSPRVSPDGTPVLDTHTLEAVNARYMKGKAYLDAGAFNDAIVEFKAVLEILPSDTDTKELMAEAVRRLDEAVDFHFKKGINYFEKEEMALAIKEWDTVLALDSNNVKAGEYKKRAELIMERLEKIKKRQTE
jgi:tetratricopeptide (TPR) repeat protein